jgi:hypothetical protein
MFRADAISDIRDEFVEGSGWTNHPIWEEHWQWGRAFCEQTLTN